MNLIKQVDLIRTQRSIPRVRVGSTLAAASFVMISNTGLLGAYVNGAGLLVNAAGTAFSTSNSLANVTFTNPATAATVTLADNSTLVTVGAYTSTFTFTGATGVTFPTTGTLATLAGSESFSGKTLVSPVISTGLTASGSAANTFVGSTGTFVTSSGLNTLSGLTAFKAIATPVAAAGTSVTDAGQLGAANQVYLSSDSAAKGVKLGTGVLGQRIEVINTSATAAVLYAASGGTLNGLSANAGVVIPASKGVRVFCSAADTWTAFDMTAHATAA